MDLAFFDQATYLISQGLAPIVSLTGVHVLGDHASWILYPLSLLYHIKPDVHWLFACQSLALAGAALPLWRLTRLAGLPDRTATAIVAAYLGHPILFGANLFDFHPDILAVPAFFWAVLSMRLGHVWRCLAALVVVLGCKEVLSLTVAAFGIWVLLFERTAADRSLQTRRRVIAVAAIALGAAWFLVATQWVIPHFGGPEPTRGRFGTLGSSMSEIALHLVRHPFLALRHMWTAANGQYLLLMLLPLVWGLSFRTASAVLPALPNVGLNLLSVLPAQTMGLQYSAAIMPFFFVAAVDGAAAGRPWRRIPAVILVCAVVAFAVASNVAGFYTAVTRPERQEMRRALAEAMVHITTPGSVLTTNDIAPHLSERRVVKLTIRGIDTSRLEEFDYILLSTKLPGLYSTPGFASFLINRLRQHPGFCEVYAQHDLYLFVFTGGGCSGRVNR